MKRLISAPNFALHAVIAAAAVMFAPPIQAQQQPPLDGLIAWWQAEGNALDSVGGHNGTLLDGVTFAAGVYGQAFSFGPTYNRVFVPDSDAFKLTNSLTMGAWIYPTAYSWHVLERGGNVGGSAPYGMGMDAVSNFEFHFRSSPTTVEQLLAPMGLNQWHYVTATLDGNTGDMRLYFDGVVVAQKFTSLRPFGDIPANLQPGLGIGNTPDVGGFPFVGLVDEVVLYSRALTPAEIQGLASVGPPVIVRQPTPTSQTAAIGSRVSISVNAAGTMPLQYQWFWGTNLLADATNSVLVLTNLHQWQSGQYWVSISNSSGSTNSLPATLSVLPQVLGIDMIPRVALVGDLGLNYRLEYISVFGPTNAWQTLETLTILQQPEYYLDVSAVGQPARYYRMVQVP